ncbi:MAG: beta-propeller domain-containing protein, partial [Candidatus Micrarchaeota archaeon]|nr:beta-propeller domain-containing protein [Candidatus Micrarchaeota archaeon]
MALAVVGIGFGAPALPPAISPTPGATATPSVVPASTDLKSFSSWDDVQSFLVDAQAGSGYGGYGNMRTLGMPESMPLAVTAEKSADASTGASAPSYSQTNVQVLGVDEADRFKTDGKNIYTLSGGSI